MLWTLRLKFRFRWFNDVFLGFEGFPCNEFNVSTLPNDDFVIEF